MSLHSHSAMSERRSCSDGIINSCSPSKYPSVCPPFRDSRARGAWHSHRQVVHSRVSSTCRVSKSWPVWSCQRKTVDWCSFLHWWWSWRWKPRLLCFGKHKKELLLTPMLMYYALKVYIYTYIVTLLMACYVWNRKLILSLMVELRHLLYWVCV